MTATQTDHPTLHTWVFRCAHYLYGLRAHVHPDGSLTIIAGSNDFGTTNILKEPAITELSLDLIRRLRPGYIEWLCDTAGLIRRLLGNPPFRETKFILVTQTGDTIELPPETGVCGNA